jgi:tRNA modification GTPase
MVLNKSDLFGNPRRPATPELDLSGRKVYVISASEGNGVAGLVSDLAAYARLTLSGAESLLIARTRHRHALQETLGCLDSLNDDSSRHELVAEGLRLAANALGRLTGRIDVEEVLDVIFRDFCIGK